MNFKKLFLVFNFGYKSEKWKMKNFQNLFRFEIKKQIILSVHGFSIIDESKGTFDFCFKMK